MTGFLDRLLHADKPQPLDVDTAAAMLSTTPGLLREFERSYHANVLDRKNAPTGPLGPDAKTVVESRSGHGLSDEALALDARIVRDADGTASFDATGRAPGRGAYVCSLECFAAACKARKLDRALRCRLDGQDYERIAGEMTASGVRCTKED